MAQIVPPTITASPAQPVRGIRATFSGLVDAFVTWLIAAVAQFGAVATNCYNNAVDAYNSAVAAAGSMAAAALSAIAAAASATAAAASAGAPVWVSGATIAQYARVMSPLDFHIYARTAATGDGTTDPSLDPNYTAVQAAPFPYLHVRDEKSAGTSGGASAAGWQTRTLQTTVGANGIAGSSLSSNAVSLPAGTYEFSASAPAHSVTSASTACLALYNATDSAYLMVGVALSILGNADCLSVVSGRFTIAATKNITLQHYISGAVANGLGNSAGSGQVNVYASLILRKVG